MSGSQNFDRTILVPPHRGPNILPADPLFTRLLALADRPPSHPAIVDVVAEISASYLDLLNDILTFRDEITNHLPVHVLRDLEAGKETWISVLAPGSYEFAVGILAVLSLGAAASPLSVVQPVAEAIYYVRKAKSVAIVTSSRSLKLGQDIELEMRKVSNHDFRCVPILKSIGTRRDRAASDILISSDPYLDANSAGILIFTSGTTGPPKGAVLRRASIGDGAMTFADQLQLTREDVLLHLLPVHHATGIWVSFFPFLQAGACIEFRSGSFSAPWTWDRWRQGGLTHFSGVPTIYMRMMQHYEQVLSKLPPGELQKYSQAPSQFKVCMCGTSALPRPINNFWTRMLNGRRITQRYGATEIGVVFNIPLDPERSVKTPDGSIGEATLGVDVKLAGGGDEGEILVRSFNLFKCYIGDPGSTKAAHNEEGYYMTGDIARREGRFYFIVGRASVDIIKSGGYKISALDVEREILSLPYVNEVMVVGVPDSEFGERVGAVVSLRTDDGAKEFMTKEGRPSTDLSIQNLRDDLRKNLAGYKLPTVLRVIKDDLPKTNSGKVIKKKLGPIFFPMDYDHMSGVQKWDSGQKAKL